MRALALLGYRERHAPRARCAGAKSASRMFVMESAGAVIANMSVTSACGYAASVKCDPPLREDSMLKKFCATSAAIAEGTGLSTSAVVVSRC